MHDVTALSDEDLRRLRQEATSETDRRDILTRTPTDVVMLARRYATAGGDLAALHAAIDTDPAG